MIKKIHEFADDIARHLEPPEKRRLKAGVLSDVYPKEQRDLANAAIIERRKDAYHVRALHKLYRFCLYPVSKINVYKFCERYMPISMTRYGECRHLNCVNCCNHLLLIMKYITS